MYPTSEKFQRSVKGSHRPFIVVKARSIDGTFVNLPISGGEVSVDRTAQDIRRSISFTVNDPDLVPVLATDPLNIYGNHVYAYRGVLWNLDNIPQQLWDAPPPLNKWMMRFDNISSGSEAPAWAKALKSDPPYELVPIGVFRINQVGVNEQEDGQLNIEVSGTDISSNIAKNAWTGPVTVWKSAYKVPVSKSDTTPEVTYVATGVHEAVKLLITDRWGKNRKSIFGSPRFDFSGVPNKPLTKPVIMGSNTVSGGGSNSPWTDITALAAGIGAEMYVDAEGAFAMKPIPDPNTIVPVWDFLDGEGGLLISAQRSLDDSKAVNYVIATGENTGTSTASAGSSSSSSSSSSSIPLKAVAFDGDPASPTYYLGEFGRVVGRESGRKKLTSQAQVKNAAETYLNWFVGGEESIEIEGVVNPALDTGDVIRVRRKRLGIYNEAKVITDLTADFPQIEASTTISQITVAPLKKAYPAGTKLVIYTNADYDIVKLSHTAAKGATTLHLDTFHPHRQYRRGTIIFDPDDLSNAGSVNHYIDKLTIPLDIDKPLQITARARRVGSRQDAIRIAEFSQGY